jgi:hypothetical protein
MEFITHILTALLIGYLSLTNSLADRILDAFNLDPVPPSAEQSNSGLPALPSLFAQAHIPNILLQSGEYQAAAVANSDSVTWKPTRWMQL